LISYLDICRRKRNVISYEGDEIGEDQAVELAEEAARFSVLAHAWLAKHHPDLA